MLLLYVYTIFCLSLYYWNFVYMHQQSKISSYLHILHWWFFFWKLLLTIKNDFIIVAARLKTTVYNLLACALCLCFSLSLFFLLLICVLFFTMGNGSPYTYTYLYKCILAWGFVILFFFCVEKLFFFSAILQTKKILFVCCLCVLSIRLGLIKIFCSNRWLWNKLEREFQTMTSTLAYHRLSPTSPAPPPMSTGVA